MLSNFTAVINLYQARMTYRNRFSSRKTTIIQCLNKLFYFSSFELAIEIENEICERNRNCFACIHRKYLLRKCQINNGLTEFRFSQV